MKRPTIIFIPGWNDTGKEPCYQSLKLIGSYRVFSPTWKYRTIEQWIAEFESYIEINKLSDYIAIGFSLGAYIIACANVSPKQTIYCSLSPLFKEDKKYWPAEMKKLIGKRRLTNLGLYLPKANSSFLVGEKEKKIMFQMANRLSKDQLKIVKGTGHEITKDYAQAILKCLN